MAHSEVVLRLEVVAFNYFKISTDHLDEPGFSIFVVIWVFEKYVV